MTLSEESLACPWSRGLCDFLEAVTDELGCDGQMGKMSQTEGTLGTKTGHRLIIWNPPLGGFNSSRLPYGQVGALGYCFH